MKKRITVLLLCFVCFLIQGCVSVISYKFAPQVLTGQKLMEQDDINNRVVSHKKASVFIRPVAATYSSEDNPAVMIGIFSEKEINFSPEDVKAYIDGEPYHILTHDESLAVIKTRYDSAVKAVNDAYNTRAQQVAGASPKNANDPSVFDPNESNRKTIGNTEQYGYKYDVNAMKRGMAEAENQRKIDKDAIVKQTTEEVEALNASELRKTTIKPDTWYQGQIKLAKIDNPGKPHKIKLVISAAGEDHDFIIDTSAVK